MLQPGITTGVDADLVISSRAWACAPDTLAQKKSAKAIILTMKISASKTLLYSLNAVTKYRENQRPSRVDFLTDPVN